MTFNTSAAINRKQMSTQAAKLFNRTGNRITMKSRGLGRYGTANFELWKVNKCAC